MSLLNRYFAALRRIDDGGISECIRIEQDTGLFGYPPELVSVGLKAIDEGRDAHQAIHDYTGAAA